MPLASLKKLTSRIKEALVARTTGGPVLALAQEYAQRCEEAAARLEQCCAMLETGNVRESLRLAEEAPALPEVLAALSFQERQEWLEYCSAEGLPVPMDLDEGLAGQLESIYTSGAAAPQRLYRDYRAAIMQGKEAKALQIIRTIARLNPADADAQSEKARLEEKQSRVVAAALREAVVAGDAANVIRLTEELEDLLQQSQLAVLAEYGAGCQVRHKQEEAVRLKFETRPRAVRAFAPQPGSIGVRRAARSPAWQDDSSATSPDTVTGASSIRWWLWVTAAVLTVGGGVWYLRLSKNPPASEVTVEIEAPSKEFRKAVSAAAWDSDAAVKLRSVEIPGDEPDSPLKSIMAEVTRQRVAPSTLADALSRLSKIRPEVDRAPKDAKLTGKLISALENEAWELCRSQKAPPAAEEVRYWPQWIDAEVAGKMAKVGIFLTVAEMDAPVFFPGDEPVWFAAECRRRNAARAEGTGKGPVPATTPDSKPAALKAPVQITIVKNWEDLNDLAPGTEWFGAMTARPAELSQIELDNRLGTFRQKGRLTNTYQFVVRGNSLIKRDDINYISIDLIRASDGGIWRIYSATAPEFESVRPVIADLPLSGRTISWNAADRTFRIPEAVTSKLRLFSLLPRQTWVLECPFPVNESDVRTLNLVNMEVARFDFISKMEALAHRDDSKDSIIQTWQRKLTDEKARMEYEIKMQQSSANADSTVNRARAAKIRESEAAFRRIKAELEAQIKNRVAELANTRTQLKDLLNRLPGPGPFYVCLKLKELSGPSIRILELRPE